MVDNDEITLRQFFLEENRKNDNMNQFLNVVAVATFIPSLYKISRWVSPTSSFLFSIAFFGGYYYGPK